MNGKSCSTHQLKYPECSMFELVRQMANQYPEKIAYDFMGKQTTFGEWVVRVENVARALWRTGIRAGDRVTICMPNTPQAIDLFYALNRIGAVSNIIHPLSAPKELEEAVVKSKSRAILVLDQLYERSAEVFARLAKTVRILVAKIPDELPTLLKIGYTVTEQRKVKTPHGVEILDWKTFLENGKDAVLPEKEIDCHETAVILYSGGTTGTTKGIEISSYSFNALALQTIDASGCGSIVGLRMLAVMPIFHGFGLGVGVHTPLVGGATCILVPKFSITTYAKLLKTRKPSFIPGVPTLFEALLRTKQVEKLDLSHLRGVFCGGDSLSPELKERVDCFLRERGATVEIREGYGATECIAVSCLTPERGYRRGSIGMPVADTSFVAVRPGTVEHVSAGEEGELCICGPTVMLRYLDQPEESAAVLREHSDGKIWLHTGDLGKIDADGYVYFIQRIKRMIVSSGYNVYPAQIEAVLNSHPAVRSSCAVGVPDPYRVQRAWVYVELEEGHEPSDQLRGELMALCRQHIAKYALPARIGFCTMPRTKVNKIDFRALEKQARETLKKESNE